MNYLILITIILTFPLIGIADQIHKLECRKLNSKDYERKWNRKTRDCFERKFNAPSLPKDGAWPIQITIEKKLSIKIEDGETKYYSFGLMASRFGWYQIISKKSPHTEVSFFYSCEEENKYYGAAAADGGGPILNGSDIPAAYFIECKII